MRMRLKKHLKERMDDCNDLVLFIENEEFYKMDSAEKQRVFDFEKLFDNSNPIMLEIGCGKGKFINEFAKNNPDINFIAVEKLSNVIVSAAEKTAKLGLKNLLYLNVSAENLLCFIKPKTIERIFLNFSCPYPKNTYANRRLTNVRFLRLYNELMVDGGEIWQKTDNQKFFEYSLEQYSLDGWKLSEVSLDLHNSDFVGNITTEYEERFLAQGGRIYRLQAHK